MVSSLVQAIVTDDPYSALPIAPSATGETFLNMASIARRSALGARFLR